MKRKLLLILMFAVLSVTAVYAQVSADDFVDNFEEVIKTRAKEKVFLFNSYISKLADYHRYRDKVNALNLFMGKGESYEENGVMRGGVKMQTMSKRTNKPSTSLMKDYLTGLMSPSKRYSKVKIDSSDVYSMQVSDLRKVGKNRYQCVVYYGQLYMGTRDGRIVYKDKTYKRIVCEVELEETVDGYEVVIKLGDVFATAIE